VCLPPAVSTAAAIAEGRYDRREAERSDQLAVTVASADERPHDLAVTAGRQAIARSGLEPSDFDLLLHVVAVHGGVDLWTPASGVQHGVGIPNGPRIVAEVRGGCNGALVGMELACSHLSAREEAAAALITAADVWPERLIDRWRTERGCPYADGA